MKQHISLDQFVELTSSGQEAIVGITGSHGFIGRRLYEILTSKGYKVIRLGRDGKVPKEVDVVFDLASYGNRFDQTDEKEIYKANFTRVVKLLNNCKGKTVILTSSSSVLLPTKTKYSEAKEKMEEYVQSWVADNKYPVLVVRPSTIVGIGDSEKHLIPKLIESAYTGELMDFVGHPTHDYLWVDDFISALILLASKATKYKGHIFNVSFGVSLSNEDIKDIVVSIIGHGPNINRVNSIRPYDTKKWDVPNNKLRNLGWIPTRTVVDVIEDMVRDYKLKHDIHTE